MGALQMSKVHHLKTIEPYFSDIRSRKKTFEIRKNDRNFQLEDALILKEYDPETDTYSGKFEVRYVIYILEGMGLSPGFVALGIEEE